MPKPKAKLYRVYYLSDASRDRMEAAEIDGVIRLTRNQFCQLSVLGDQFAGDDEFGEFELEPVKPLSFKSVWDSLPKPYCQQCERETTNVTHICDRCEAKMKCDNCGKSLKNKSWTEVRPDAFYCDPCTKKEKASA